MGEHTGIEWADSTFNPWWGCTRVSRACDHCYAATFANRYNFGWGPEAPPRVFGDKHWNEPLKWDRLAAKSGKRPRVFCASMADVFESRDNEHMATLIEQRTRLWDLIARTPNLDWLLLTKRPENVAWAVPPSWLGYRDGAAWEVPPQWPANVWLGCTVENQEQADKRIPELLKVPARIRFLSVEPMLGPIDLRYSCFNGADSFGSMPGVLWVIAGGESGHGARPTHPDWFRSLRDQCVAAGVPYFFKQWGDWAPLNADGVTSSSVVRPATGPIRDWSHRDMTTASGESFRGRPAMTRIGVGPDLVRVGKKLAGRVLDGRTWDEVPS